MDPENLRWIAGISLAIILALIAAIHANIMRELSSLRRSVHELRDKLPEIIVQWINLVKNRDKD